LAVNQSGVAVIATAGARLSDVIVDARPITCELVCVRVAISGYICTVVVIYRSGSTAVQPAFFDELADLLDGVATLAEPLYVPGGLNIHLDLAEDANTVRLVNLLASYGLDMQVTGSTH
jgi:hypothetical protein